MEAKPVRHVALAVVRDGPDRVLLIDRVSTKEHGWAFPGGNLKADESAGDGVKRHILEETGIPVFVWKELGTKELPERNAIVHYVACTPSGLPTQEGDRPEIRGHAWVELDELGNFLPLEQLHPSVAEFLFAYQQAIADEEMDVDRI